LLVGYFIFEMRNEYLVIHIAVISVFCELVIVQDVLQLRKEVVEEQCRAVVPMHDRVINCSESFVGLQRKVSAIVDQIRYHISIIPLRSPHQGGYFLRPTIVDLGPALLENTMQQYLSPLSGSL
jgi:hypothetical protein